jgi:RimJ/RimL family protein N-acetyltransferase
MELKIHELHDGPKLLIREATAEDARSVLDYTQQISCESDFLTFGPGEFGITEKQEVEILENSRKTENMLFILGLVNDKIVSILNFSGGKRKRVEHCGEFGLTVLKEYWGAGIGSLMIDALTAWAKNTKIIKKINLRARTDNKRAISLYERKGFVKEGTIRKEIFIDGKFYDHYWMSIEIDDFLIKTSITDKQAVP